MPELYFYFKYGQNTFKQAKNTAIKAVYPIRMPRLGVPAKIIPKTRGITKRAAHMYTCTVLQNILCAGS